MFDENENNEWIRDMFCLAEIGLPACVVAFGDNAKMVGLSVVFLGECANDDAIATIGTKSPKHDCYLISEPGALL